METNELLALLLAAQVRSIAADKRIAAARVAHADSADQATFKAVHPLAEFVPAALADLRAIDTIIRRS